MRAGAVVSRPGLGPARRRPRARPASAWSTATASRSRRRGRPGRSSSPSATAAGAVRHQAGGRRRAARSRCCSASACPTSRSPRWRGPTSTGTSQPDHLTCLWVPAWPSRWRPSWPASPSWSAPCGPAARGTASRRTRASPATCSRRPTRCWRRSTSWAAPTGYAHLEEELGDLLFQVAFHATLAAEEGQFTLADVARNIHDKLVERHPHVFGPPGSRVPNWEELKKSREGAGQRDGRRARATCPRCCTPSRCRARRHRSASTGKTRPARGPRSTRSSRSCAASPSATTAAAHAVNDELGDVLFSVVNVARHLGVDPESALRDAAAKFRRPLRGHGGPGGGAGVGRSTTTSGTRSSRERVRLSGVIGAASRCVPTAGRRPNRLPFHTTHRSNNSTSHERDRAADRAGDPRLPGQPHRRGGGAARVGRDRPGRRAVGRVHRAPTRPSSCATAATAIGGKGVRQAVEHVNGEIARGVEGLEALDQRALDAGAHRPGRHARTSPASAPTPSSASRSRWPTPRPTRSACPCTATSAGSAPTCCRFR